MTDISKARVNIYLEREVYEQVVAVARERHWSLSFTVAFMVGGWLALAKSQTGPTTNSMRLRPEGGADAIRR